MATQPLDQALELLSYNDMAIVESKSGTRIAGLDSVDANLPRFMQALHYVLAKREDPTVSFDACGDMGPADFESLLGRLGAPKD